MQVRLALILSCVLLTTASSAEDRPPNIVIFLVDDMGLMDTSVPFLTDREGKLERHPLNDFYRTPNMQRLADQGVRFSRFYAMSVCSPTRTSILTGQTSARHHTTQYIKPESNNAGAFGAQAWAWEGIAKGEATLPALLKEAGYRTIHCGKAHFGPVGAPAEDPTNLGFDINIAGCAWGQPGSYYGTQNFGNGIPKRQNRAVPGLDKYHGQDIYLTEALTLEMNAAISESVKAEKPFFAYMAHYAVHAPFEADRRFVDHYPDSKKQLAAFASMIEGMDKSLGDMLDHLERARRRREHPRPVPRRQRHRRTDRRRPRDLLRRPAAWEEGDALRGRDARPIHCRLGEAGARAPGSETHPDRSRARSDLSSVRSTTCCRQPSRPPGSMRPRARPSTASTCASSSPRDPVARASASS